MPEFGGLIRNGDFEQEAEGKPLYWAKVGGTLSLDGSAYRGQYSALLDSETSSLKWVHQVAAVTGGSWYAANGRGRVSAGTGEVFLRISWYEADDGSGVAVGNSDGPSFAASAWALLATGPLQAPSDAHSARVRLVLRPSSAAPAAGAFDDITFLAVSAPPATPTPVTNGAPGATPTSGTPDIEQPAATRTRTTGPLTGGATSPARTPTPEVFRVVATPGEKTLRLSEIMSDPAESGSDTTFEWVELVNVGTVAVDLAGWKIGDAKLLDALPTAILQPGGFVVVAARAAVLPAGVLVVRVADGIIGGGLNNAGDTVRLFAPDGEEVDSVSFGNNSTVFDPAPPAPGPGASLGVRVAGGDPAGENWALTDKPSPGAPNTFPSRSQPKRAATVAVAEAAPADDRPNRLIESDGGTTAPLLITVLAAGVGFLGLWMSRARIGPLVRMVRRRFGRGG